MTSLPICHSKINVEFYTKQTVNVFNIVFPWRERRWPQSRVKFFWSPSWFDLASYLVLLPLPSIVHTACGETNDMCVCVKHFRKNAQRHMSKYLKLWMNEDCRIGCKPKSMRKQYNQLMNARLCVLGATFDLRYHWVDWCLPLSLLIDICFTPLTWIYNTYTNTYRNRCIMYMNV